MRDARSLDYLGFALLVLGLAVSACASPATSISRQTPAATASILQLAPVGLPSRVAVTPAAAPSATALVPTREPAAIATKRPPTGTATSPAPTKNPSRTPTAMRTKTPMPQPVAGSGESCDAAYPDVCIPPPPPDLDCADVPYRNFRVLPPDPHRFDGSPKNGIGCER